MTQVLTPAAVARSSRRTRPTLRLTPAGVPLLAALLSSGITLASFSAVDACAATTHATATYAAPASASA